MTIPKRLLRSPCWRSSSTRVAPVVTGAIAIYARMRGRGFSNTGAVVGGSLCRWEWHCECEKSFKAPEMGVRKRKGRKKEKRRKSKEGRERNKSEWSRQIERERKSGTERSRTMEQKRRSKKSGVEEVEPKRERKWASNRAKCRVLGQTTIRISEWQRLK